MVVVGLTEGDGVEGVEGVEDVGVGLLLLPPSILDISCPFSCLPSCPSFSFTPISLPTPTPIPASSNTVAATAAASGDDNFGGWGVVVVTVFTVTCITSEISPSPPPSSLFAPPLSLPLLLAPLSGPGWGRMRG